MAQVIQQPSSGQPHKRRKMLPSPASRSIPDLSKARIVLENGRSIRVKSNGVESSYYFITEEDEKIYSKTWTCVMEVEKGDVIRCLTPGWMFGKTASVTAIDEKKRRIRVSVYLRESTSTTDEQPKKPHRAYLNIGEYERLGEACEEHGGSGYSLWNDVGPAITFDHVRDLIADGQAYVSYVCGVDRKSGESSFFVARDHTLRTWLRVDDGTSQPLVRIRVPFHIVRDILVDQFSPFWASLFDIFEEKKTFWSKLNPYQLTTETIHSLRTRFLDMLDEIISFAAELYRFATEVQQSLQQRPAPSAHPEIRGQASEEEATVIRVWRRALRRLLFQPTYPLLELLEYVDKGWDAETSSPVDVLSKIADRQGTTESSLELKLLRLKNFAALEASPGRASLKYLSQHEMVENAWQLPLACPHYDPKCLRRTPAEAAEDNEMGAYIESVGPLDEASEGVMAKEFCDRRKKWSKLCTPPWSTFEVGDCVGVNSKDLISASGNFAFPASSISEELDWRLRRDVEHFVVAEVFSASGSEVDGRPHQVFRAVPIDMTVSPKVVIFHQGGADSVVYHKARTRFSISALQSLVDPHSEGADFGRDKGDEDVSAEEPGAKMVTKT